MITFSARVSLLQINVSLNGRLRMGLSSIVKDFVMVSIHPLVLVTINCTCALAGEGYFHTESLLCAVSARVVLSQNPMPGIYRTIFRNSRVRECIIIQEAVYLLP